MIKHPYYMIDFSASACMFEIRINDYPVINMNIEGQVSTTIPINFAILETGKQTISATVLPNLGEINLHQKAELKFNLKLFDVTNDFLFQSQLNEYQSDSIENKAIPVLKYIGTFDCEVPYKLNAWQNGKNLKDIEDCRKKLESEYSKIVKLINNGRFDEYINLISNREMNMRTSMYLSASESEARIKELLVDFSKGFKIQPISKDTVMCLYANNRVAVLKKLNGEPALSLINTETEEELMLDISFYIPEGKEEFEII